MKDDVIYISVNNWFSGRDYPPLECFHKWLGNDLKQTFKNDEWAKENKLCIYYGNIDMSWNYTISAPREWVEKNCPELLTNEEYTYYTTIISFKKKFFGLFGPLKEVHENVEHKKKYRDFVWRFGDDEPGEDYFDMPFREYKEENFGSKYYETHYWDCDAEDDDEDDDPVEDEK